MLMKKITLYNFRQYYGKVEIEFSTDKEKNVTVLIGDNGTGKTTLLQAFIYCLYGKDYITLNKKEELLNFKVLKDTNGNANVYVELVFLHGNKEYKIRREREYFQSTTNKRGFSYNKDEFTGFVRDKNGTTKVIEKQVQAIIPPQLIELFFFDGERMRMLAEENAKKILSNAVVNMLGLNSYEETLKLLKSNNKYCVENLFRTKIKPVNDDIKNLKKFIDKNQSSLSEIEEDLINKSIEKEYLEKQEKKYRNEILAYKPSKEAQKQREQLQNLINSIEQNIEKSEKKIYNDFAIIGTDLILNNLIDNVKTIINNSELNNKGIVGLSAIAIDELIKNGQCLCGAKIEKNNEVYNKLIEWKKYLPPQNMASLLVGMKNHIEAAQTNLINNYNKIVQEYKEILKSKEEIRKKEDEIRFLSNKIINLEGIESVEKKYQEVKAKIDSIIKGIGALEFEKEQIERKLEKYKKKEEELLNKDKENKTIKNKLMFLNEIYNLIKDAFDKKVYEAKFRLQKNASDIYKKLLNEQYYITLNKDYSFEVLDSNNNIITEIISEGEKVVSSFAFVGALIQTAIELNKSTKQLENYPLVMDAPFAKLDNKHRGNVGKTIPDLAGQIIIFTIDSQWEGAVEKKMSIRVGKSYNLMKNDKEHITKIEEKICDEI